MFCSAYKGTKLKTGDRSSVDPRSPPRLIPASVAVGIHNDGKLAGVSMLLDARPEDTRVRWNGGKTIRF